MNERVQGTRCPCALGARLGSLGLFCEAPGASAGLEQGRLMT